MARKKVRKLSDVMNMFCTESENFRNGLGLTEWEVEYRLGGCEHRNIAEISYSSQDSTATVRLNDDLEDNYRNDDYFIKDTAQHEMLHLLLGPLQAMCEQDVSTRFNANREVHRVIHRLLNYINKVIPNNKCRCDQKCE